MFLITALLTWIDRSHMRKELLRYNDRVLADIGYSRELLEHGVRAWPWRAPVDSWQSLGRFKLAAPSSEPDYAAAVAALKSWTDSELMDLDLTRDDIETAVRHGRAGFPEEQQQAA